MSSSIAMTPQKKIALVAHDSRKRELIEWAKKHKSQLISHTLYGTGTTGRLLEEEVGLKVQKLASGPLGGDQQIGAKITEGEIDFLIFLWDPLMAQPHDPDVKALLRLAGVWNVPLACNRATADFMISSPLMDQDYSRSLPKALEIYTKREIPK